MIESKRNLFIKSLQNINNEEINLLKMQEKYRNGEINAEELTGEQIVSLIALYNKQITSLKKSNQV